MWRSTILLFFIFLFTSCFQESHSPKPEGYPRLTFPERSGYKKFKRAQCPFTFKYPSYAKIVKDTASFDTLSPPHPCWFNIELSPLNGNIYMSFKSLQREGQKLGKVLSETHTLTFKHTVKAEYIDQVRLSVKKHDVYGIYYKVGGNAASPIQFFLTDSQNYFLRGALYFRNPPNADSLRPVVNFVKKDIKKIINTLQWKPIN